jgi:chromosome partitioning protein
VDAAITLTAIEAPTSPRRPIRIAVANQKGGVAKTTTAVSLGGALIRRGFDVLLVDLDPQSNLTLAVGLDPAKVRGSSADILLNSAPLAGLSRPTHVSGLDIIPASPVMETAERFLSLRPNHETILKNALGSPEQPASGLTGYEIVLFDCPPTIGSIMLNALTAADLLIIPTQPEYFSVHALRSMLQTVRTVRAQHNPGLTYRILITLKDRRNRIHRQLSEQIQTAFPNGVFQTAIEIDTKLRESAAAGLPITHYLPSSRGALQYEALAEETIRYVQAVQATR